MTSDNVLNKNSISSLISVIMSVYNDEVFLEESLKSIACQSYSNFECIIIDDASTDQSRDILKKFAEQDKRFRIYRNEDNQGLGKNLNFAISKAKGQYLARMDGDDICLPLRFEKQVKFLQDNSDITVLGSWVSVIDETGKLQDESERTYATEHDDIIKNLWANPMLHPSVMMRRDALIDLGGYPELRRRQDYALWFNAYQKGWRFANLGESLLFYRVTSAHLKKSSIRDSFLQVKIGMYGYFKMGGKSPFVYIALTYPFLRSLTPSKLRVVIDKAVKKLDPRKKKT